jgi:tetraacyldisaccharide 4'-kinase
MLVTGIANSGPLKKFLREFSHIREELAFPDHHNYDRKDFQLMKSTFKTIEAEDKFIITTEKDAVRMRAAGIADKNFSKSFYYIPVEVKFLAKGEKPFIKRIYRFMKKYEHR